MENSEPDDEYKQYPANVQWLNNYAARGNRPVREVVKRPLPQVEADRRKKEKKDRRAKALKKANAILDDEDAEEEDEEDLSQYYCVSRLPRPTG